MNISQTRLHELGYEPGTCVEGTYSARLDLGEQLPAHEIVRRIGSLVADAAQGDQAWPVSGFVAVSPSESSDSVLFACDPNRKGNPSPEESRIFVPKLASAYQEKYGDVELTPEDIMGDFRTLPGLSAGYYDYKNPGNPENKVFSMDDALGRLPQSTAGLSVVEGTVWSARYRSPDGDPYYLEPGLSISGTEDSIDPILQMANRMLQDRIVFEIPDVETQVIQRPR